MAGLPDADDDAVGLDLVHIRAGNPYLLWRIDRSRHDRLGDDGRRRHDRRCDYGGPDDRVSDYAPDDSADNSADETRPEAAPSVPPVSAAVSIVVMARRRRRHRTVHGHAVHRPGMVHHGRRTRKTMAAKPTTRTAESAARTAKPAMRPCEKRSRREDDSKNNH